MRTLIYARQNGSGKFGSLLTVGRVQYHAFHMAVVFTGCDCEAGLPSTDASAEVIIRKICRQLGCQPKDRQFYDVQTHFGYASMRPDTFLLVRLWLGRNGSRYRVVSREFVEHPPALVEEFLHLLHRPQLRLQGK